MMKRTWASLGFSALGALGCSGQAQQTQNAEPGTPPSGLYSVVSLTRPLKPFRWAAKARDEGNLAGALALLGSAKRAYNRLPSAWPYPAPGLFAELAQLASADSLSSDQWAPSLADPGPAPVEVRKLAKPGNHVLVLTFELKELRRLKLCLE